MLCVLQKAVILPFSRDFAIIEQIIDKLEK